ncbi:hypothetical protein AK812_SmicGene17121 [Symbiodinium microadriaticum]|uniref:Uncharacterized protein n=1 Tax=Symbiodinium microadriaticum TaxID=2951 RepID=A0A1Q9DYH6_SYMMI|nr:hypothetical protein AK812_SmicGene17121 [Symbiodinium microadriaticum]
MGRGTPPVPPRNDLPDSWVNEAAASALQRLTLAGVGQTHRPTSSDAPSLFGEWYAQTEGDSFFGAGPAGPLDLRGQSSYYGWPGSQLSPF